MPSRSLGSPHRRAGRRSSITALKGNSSFGTSPYISVWNHPAQTMFARMPYGPYSSATLRIIDCIADLAAP